MTDPVKVLHCKERAPKIRAVQVPSPCTMDDATEIEKAFRVKRSQWSARSDRVDMLKLSDSDREVHPGWFIVEIDGPDGWSCEAMRPDEFKDRFKVKGS